MRAISTERRLEWAALDNARDLGGLPGPAGTTPFGAIARTDSLFKLTEAGQAAMLAAGVTTIIDLRSPDELTAAPSPVRELAGYRSLPLLSEGALERIGAFDDAVESYRWQVDSEVERIGIVFNAMAAAPAGGLVVHCTAGKDRTGMVVAFLLELVRVDRDAIAADFALSAPNLEAQLQRELEDAEDRERRLRLRRIYDSRPESILALLEHVDERYGGVVAYLDAAGVGAAARERLAGRLQ